MADSIEALKSKKDQKMWSRRPVESEAIQLATIETATLVVELYPKLKKWVNKPIIKFNISANSEILMFWFEKHIL